MDSIIVYRLCFLSDVCFSSLVSVCRSLSADVGLCLSVYHFSVYLLFGVCVCYMYLFSIFLNIEQSHLNVTPDLGSGQLITVYFFWFCVGESCKPLSELHERTDTDGGQGRELVGVICHGNKKKNPKQNPVFM